MDHHANQWKNSGILKKNSLSAKKGCISLIDSIMKIAETHVDRPAFYVFSAP